jgi:hypothetical protein
MSVGPLGRQPAVIGRNTCARSTIGGGGVGSETAGVSAGDVEALGVALALCGAAVAEGVVVATVAVGVVHAALVMTIRPAMTVRIERA